MTLVADNVLQTRFTWIIINVFEVNYLEVRQKGNVVLLNHDYLIVY